MAGTVSPEYPSSSDKRGAGELKIVNSLKTAVSTLNAILNSENKVDPSLFKTTDQYKFKWYEPKIIPTEETRENTSFGKLATADEIKEVIVPENSLILVNYSGLVKNSVGGTLRASLFIGANQLKKFGSSEAPPVQESSGLTNTSNWGTVVSSATGIQIIDNLTGSNSFVTTGLVAATGGQGAPFYIQKLAAGTYNISIQFKSSSGSITAKERLLQVGVMG